MLRLLKQEANVAYTENGAVTRATTGSDCLDLFASIGGLRRESEGDIVGRFLRAYAEDPDLAMKILFFARDVRGGLGERRVFRVILRWLADREPQSVRRNIPYIAEYGRFDDLLVLLGTGCEGDAVACVKAQLDADLTALEGEGQVSLLAKWLPSVNASNAGTVRTAKRLARLLGMDDARYRKTLVRLRARIRLMENHLRERDYSFDYEKQPSKALYKYRKAFLRSDEARYRDFLNRVAAGEARMNTGTLAPYELVEPFLSSTHWRDRFDQTKTQGELDALDATWNALPDFCDGRNALAVVDTSGSMYGYANPMPAAVALSLGLYFAERNTGAFHNHFITFSERPQLIELKGKRFSDRLRYAASFSEVANTDIEAVFDLVLQTAVKHRVRQKDLPEQLIIISDMEFDSCAENGSLSNFENARRKYARAGYRLPRLVFWNVASRNRQQPVTQNQQGVTLVSGCTPRLFSMVASGAADPYAFMVETLGAERYDRIAA